MSTKEERMKQPSDKAAKLILQLIKNTTLPIVLEKLKQENERKGA